MSLQVLDLSSYYKEGENPSIPPGSSFFAVEFDRLNGRISEGSVEMKSGSGGKEEEKESSSGGEKGITVEWIIHSIDYRGLQ